MARDGLTCFRLSSGRLILSIAAVLAGAMNTVSAQPVAQWTQVNAQTPTARWRHVAAYDVDRGVMVVFGGRAEDATTWEWVSATNTWRSFPQSGPGSKGGAAMAYDRARKLTILTGGGGATAASLREVWAWNGASWLRLSDLPDDRQDHSMAFDVARSQLVLYGGNTGANGRRTLIWSGSTWEIRQSAFDPQFLAGHSMAYDIGRDRTVLVRSNEGSGSLLTYEWDGTNWAAKNPAGSIFERPHPVIAYDEGRQRIVLMGGDGNNQTWEYFNDAWTLRNTNTSGLGGRDEHVLVYDTVDNQTLLFGGAAGRTNPQRDLWGWNGTVWTAQSQTASPPPRSFRHEYAFDSTRGVVVVYGGLNVNTSDNAFNLASGGHWEWNGSVWTGVAPATTPGTRWRAAMTYDTDLKKIVYYGGRDNTESTAVRNDTWEFINGNWVLATTSGPGPRQMHSMVYDSARKRVVLFGGTNSESDSTGRSDTWEYNPATKTWAQVATTGPAARWDAAMVYDRARGKTVLFGGTLASGIASDTWEWNGNSWAQIQAVGPSARAASGFTYDSRRRLMLVFGGVGPNSAILGDLWAFNGSSWTQYTNAGAPQARAYSVFEYDEQRDRAVMFGGRITTDGNYANAQTFEVALPCPADFNHDEFVDAIDYDLFLIAWTTNQTTADLNDDGFVDALDYDAFVAAFFGGC